MKSILRLKFVKDALILITGTGSAQAIPLLVSPLLTRIYSPMDFGGLGLFMAASSIAAFIATGMYEVAIMLPNRNRSALNLLALICISSSIVSLLIFFVINFLGLSISNATNSVLSIQSLYLLPLGVLFNGCFQGLIYWFTRNSHYKMINYVRISQSVITVVVSITLGFLSFKKEGLIVGYLTGLLVSIFPLIFLLIRRQRLITRSQMMQMGWQYVKYPMIIMPTSLMNAGATQAPIFFISKFYTPFIVGGFSFANRILLAPVAIISSTIGQVYFQRMSEITRQSAGKISGMFLKTFKTLCLASLLLFLPLFLFGEEIFGFVFGSQWTVAGQYVRVMALAIAVKFIVSPLSSIFHITNKIFTVSIWQAGYLFSTIALFVLFSHLPFYELLWFYTTHEIVIYSIYFFLMITTSKRFDRKRAVVTQAVSSKNAVLQ